jgi:hypothetical protein
MSGNSGGNMANDTISDWGNALSPFLSAYNSYVNKGNTADAYKNAQQLITTPSADQQMYRSQLANLMKNPGSMDSSPVYQAMLDQGMNAVNRTSAAQGMLGSGNRLSELMKMGQKTASQYYFPQQQALAQLSGVPGDQAARALAAQAGIAGNNANMGLNGQMLDSLLQGAGVQSPQQQMLNALLGKGSTGGTSPLSSILSGVKGLFGGTDMSGYVPDAFTGSGYDSSFNTPTDWATNAGYDPNWFDTGSNVQGNSDYYWDN